MLINITGGNDLTLFGDQSVNKIRAEVDPEAELIFGAIKDENMTGKIRVSIVATSLDGNKTESKTVLNMVSRIQNRNTGYSENLFSHNQKTENNTLNSIYGATALKLDETYELQEEQQNSSLNQFENDLENNSLKENSIETEENLNDVPSGVSIESASYIEKNNLDENTSTSLVDEISDEECTPRLFSEESNYQNNEKILETDNQEAKESEELFEQDIDEDDDFEIPAFLRKQKF